MEDIDNQVQIKKRILIIDVVLIVCLAGIFLNFGLGRTGILCAFSCWASALAKYAYRKGKNAYIKWVGVIAWANIITCLIPILGFATGSFSLTYGACTLEKGHQTNKYILLGGIAILPYLIFFVVTTVLYFSVKSHLIGNV